MKTVLAIIMVLGLAFGAPLLYAQAQGARLQVFRVGNPAKGSGLTGLGTARCFRSLDLGFETQGVVAEMKVQEGDRVAKGALLARLESGVIEAQAKAKKVELDRARNLVRFQAGKVQEQRQLFQARAVSLRELKDEEQKLAEDKSLAQRTLAELAALQARLRASELRAPLAGEIAKVLHQAGEVVNPREPAAIRLLSCGRMLAEVALGEKVYPRIRKGLKVAVTADALPGRHFVGSIHSIAPEVDEKERTFLVKVLLDNRQGSLRQGMFIRAAVLGAGPGRVLTIPLQAVVAREGNRAVIQVLKNGVRQKSVVTLGREQGSLVQVIQGLEPGDLVVIPHPPPPREKDANKP